MKGTMVPEWWRDWHKSIWDNKRKEQMITVKEMVIKYLEENGYDGLWWNSGGGDDCGCRLDDLFPCDDRVTDCQPGYEVLLGDVGGVYGIGPKLVEVARVEQNEKAIKAITKLMEEKKPNICWNCGGTVGLCQHYSEDIKEPKVFSQKADIEDEFDTMNQPFVAGPRPSGMDVKDWDWE